MFLLEKLTKPTTWHSLWNSLDQQKNWIKFFLLRFFHESVELVQWTLPFFSLMLHSHALSPTDRLHNSFHFNLSIHLFAVPSLLCRLRFFCCCCWAWMQTEKSWSKFNSSEASNRNSLSKVMMQWWKTTCFTLSTWCKLPLRYTFTEAGFFSSPIIAMHNYRALNILCSSFFFVLHHMPITLLISRLRFGFLFLDPSFGRGIINRNSFWRRKNFYHFPHIHAFMNTNFCFH
jgi:hypothetical protein